MTVQDMPDTIEEKKLPLEHIRTDGGTQPRDGLIEDEVDEYVYQIGQKAKFPPIEVVYDGAEYYVWDGFHRLEAHRRAKKKDILARVQQGTREDAVWLSYRANITNGIRRSPSDRQRAVSGALQHARSRGMTDKDLAGHCGVDPSTVSKYRKRLIEEGVLPDPDAPEGTGAARELPDQAQNGTEDAEERPAEEHALGDPAAAAADNGLEPPEAVEQSDGTEGMEPDDGLDEAPSEAPMDAEGEPDATAPAPPPTLPDDLADMGWTLAQTDDQRWQGQHEELGLQTEPHADPAAASAQVYDLARSLGAEVADEQEQAPDAAVADAPAADASDTGPAPTDTPAVDAAPADQPQTTGTSTDRVQRALSVNLLGVMYQAADERWQQFAPGEDAWTAVPFDYEHLLVVAHTLLDSPTMQDALARLRS